MISSSEDAMPRVKAWVAAKAPIRAVFLSASMNFWAYGRLALSTDDSELFFTSDDEKTRLTVSLPLAKFTETLEPLLEAPEEMHFKVDFFAAVSLCLPSGSLDLLEVAEWREVGD